MTLTLPKDALVIQVDRISTGFGEPDFTIPADHIENFRFAMQAGKAMDEGEITINNDHFRYTDDPNGEEISIGDRLIVLAKPPGTDARFGYGPFGYGPFGGWSRIGIFWVRDEHIIGYGARSSDLSLTLLDWVFATMERRRIWYSASNTPLSGSSDAVLNEILAERCPEIDRSALPVIEEPIDYRVSGKTVREVVDELAGYAAYLTDPILQASHGEALIFQPITDIKPKFPDPLPGGSFGPLASSAEGHNLINRTRISGGIDDTDNIADEQVIVDDYVTVTEDNPLQIRVDAVKSELTTIQVWTRGQTTSEDGVRVRLQADDGNGSPVNLDNLEVDHANSTRKVALATDGWSTFELEEHSLNERRPWLIIDSEGSTGHEVGINSAGDPAYRVYFPKPVEAVVEDFESQREYGVSDAYVERKSLTTTSAIRSVANAKHERQAWPDRTLGSITARSEDAHDLIPGDVIHFDRPGFRAEGQFIVTKREQTYSGLDLDTTLDFAGIDTYA